MLSDDSTSDSDTGIRFKTDSTRRPTSHDHDSNRNNDRDRNDRRNNDSARKNDSYSSSRRDRRDRSRERSPLRDRYAKEQKSRADLSRPENSHRKERVDRENGSSHNNDRKKHDAKQSSESSRKPDDGKSHEKSERHSKSNRVEIDNRTDNHRDAHDKAKPSESKSVNERKSFSESREKHSAIRNIMHKHLQQAVKEDKRLSNSSERTRHSEDRKHDDYSRNKSNESRKSGDSSSKVRSEIKHTVNNHSHDHTEESIRKSDKVKSNASLKHAPISSSHRTVESHGDQEQKPISYYNMISTNMQNDHSSTVIDAEDETIALSDSSVDEHTLREQASLLKEELKVTKEKRKSKHKDKKRCRKKRLNKILSDGKAISNHLETDTSPKNHDVSVNEKQSDQSNEEGEILSDSDEKSTKSTTITSESFPSKPQMPDLRERLSSKFTKVENVFGPTLPPRLKPKERITEDVDEVEGPALPPHLMKPSEKKEKNIGPHISSDVRQKLSEKAHEKHSSDSDNDESIGPLPVGAEAKWTKAHKTLEERALQLKIKAIEGNDEKDSQIDAREEWMLKLPDAKVAHLGLTSRQFRAKEGPDMSDRTSWTDTPETRALKESGIIVDEEADSSRLQKDATTEFIKQRDADQEDIIKKFKKKTKRDASLLDIHQKKLKKKKKKSEKEKPERKPFSRDNDLKVNRFDEAQKKAILKKAQLLDTRFSKGESKYL